MAGLNPCGVFATGGLQRLKYPQILYLSEFHHIPLMWLSYKERMLPSFMSHGSILLIFKIACVFVGKLFYPDIVPQSHHY